MKRWSQEVCVSCTKLFRIVGSSTFTFSLYDSLLLSLHLCHVMPYNAIDYSSTTWTITFGGCRTDVFDLMFCWCHSCTVEVPVDFHVCLLTHINSETMMIDWLVKTTILLRCDLFIRRDNQSMFHRSMSLCYLWFCVFFSTLINS